MSDSIRRLRYLFERQLLPGVVFRVPSLASGMEVFGLVTMPAMWSDAMEEATVPAAKAPVEPRWAPPVETLGYRVAVVTMPRPTATGEAYMLAIAAPSGTGAKKGRGGGSRYLTLEMNDLGRGPPKTMLCEWTSKGAHCNYGDGPKPTAKAFLAAVAEKLRDSDEAMPFSLDTLLSRARAGIRGSRGRAAVCPARASPKSRKPTRRKKP